MKQIGYFSVVTFLIIGLAGISLTLIGAVHNPARQLRDSLLDSTALVDDLHYLCDGIGGRVTGSEACERSVDWAAERFREAGMDEIRTERFEMPAVWEEFSARAEAVGPILMGMGNRAHIVTPATTVRGLFNIAALAGTPVDRYA